ncbi:hypothetical protein OF83DRAFT_1086534 [Amylostereum chailletii]|nr:hypothetical protein OF83DRAFT_1086534 [Amylostereum chailletii]
MHPVLRFPLPYRRIGFLPSRYLSCTPPTSSDHRASSKLFQDSAREEAASQPQSKTPPALRESENWTGDERMEDAVLRMLVDKYKPLRAGTIRTAEDKLKQAPPSVLSAVPQLSDENLPSSTSTSTQEETSSLRRSTPYDPNVPLIPSIEGHRPWHTTFKVPSHATSNVKYGAIPTPTPRRAASPASDLDEKTRRKERETLKRTQAAGRLTHARESTLDYRLGIRSGQPKQGYVIAGGGRPNPASVKGWVGLVEERIERARQEGHFRVVKGRGKPIERQTDEGNPFIGREEFLMNRIVQRQGAAPPWVEVQGGLFFLHCRFACVSNEDVTGILELESALTSFRTVLRDSWTRRAIRMLTAQPRFDALSLTLADVQAHRDPEWEARERAYHDTAVGELNALVRKYNGLAPYAVRRAYYVLGVELEKVYEESGADVLEGVMRRVESGDEAIGRGYVEEGGGQGGGRGEGGVLRVWDVILGWFWRR